MARPTNDKKETTLILRVNTETKDRLTGEAEREHISLSEYLRKKLGDNSVIQNPIMADLMKMLSLCGIGYEDFIKIVHKALENGDISIENGEIRTRDSLDLERLYEVCHERGIDPQEAIDKTVKMIERG